MELINNKYVVFDKMELILYQMEAFGNKNEKKANYFANLINVILNYEKENNEYVGFIHVNYNDLGFKESFGPLTLSVSRKTLSNVLLFAAYNNDIDVLLDLGGCLSEDVFDISQLGELKDYILEHSIDINEYFEGEKERFIYDEEKNSIKKGYVYSEKKNGFTKKRK